MNKTDRDLLELAAKAAGIVVLGIVDGPDGGITHWWKGASWGLQIEGVDGIWNALVDDGDAFRLAVKLGIGMRHHVNWSQVFSLQTGVDDFHHDTDPYSATRRAIVRAAAEIGRMMK